MWALFAAVVCFTVDQSHLSVTAQQSLPGTETLSSVTVSQLSVFVLDDIYYVAKNLTFVLYDASAGEMRLLAYIVVRWLRSLYECIYELKVNA